MTNQILNRPLVRVNQGCVSNPPEGCTATNIGTWSVRSLNGGGKLQNLFMEMTCLKGDILGISETHFGLETPESFETQGFVVIYSSRKDGNTRNQVDYIVIPNESLRTVENCKVFNSADIGSDHYLIMA